MGRPARGGEWERRAERWLSRRGLRLLARNFHCRQGELDLVMQDGESTVFIEVRYGQCSAFGSPAASVDMHKQLRIQHAASIFLVRNPRLAQAPCRFDVLAISGRRPWPRFEWLQDAFRLH